MAIEKPLPEPFRRLCNLVRDVEKRDVKVAWVTEAEEGIPECCPYPEDNGRGMLEARLRTCTLHLREFTHVWGTGLETQGVLRCRMGGGGQVT